MNENYVHDVHEREAQLKLFFIKTINLWQFKSLTVVDILFLIPL